MIKSTGTSKICFYKLCNGKTLICVKLKTANDMLETKTFLQVILIYNEGEKTRKNIFGAGSRSIKKVDISDHQFPHPSNYQ